MVSNVVARKSTALSGSVRSGASFTFNNRLGTAELLNSIQERHHLVRAMADSDRSNVVDRNASSWRKTGRYTLVDGGPLGSAALTAFKDLVTFNQLLAAVAEGGLVDVADTPEWDATESDERFIKEPHWIHPDPVSRRSTRIISMPAPKFRCYAAGSLLTFPQYAAEEKQTTDCMYWICLAGGTVYIGFDQGEPESRLLKLARA